MSNWFQRHLNWTTVLALFSGYILASISSVGESEIALLGWLFSIAIILGSCAWVVQEKNRSMWNLLLLIIPFGFIVFLSLENKSKLVSEEKATEELPTLAKEEKLAKIREQLERDIEKRKRQDQQVQKTQSDPPQD